MKIALILAFILFIFPVIALLGPSKLRDGIFAHLIYKVIACKVTKGLNSDEEKALSLFWYVNQHLYAPPSSEAAGKSLLQVLARNVAWCDQQSDILAVLSRRCWINGGYVTLYGYDPISHHTVCALYLHGKYRMFDPLYGYIFYKKNGQIATLKDIQEKGVELKSVQFDAWHKLTGDVAYDYFNLYESTHPWEMHIPRTPIWLKYIDYYYDLFGDSFLSLFQELYFQIKTTPLFMRARLKHLGHRFEAAIEDYTKIIEEEQVIHSETLSIDYNPITKDIIKAEASFFRAQAYWDLNAYKKCISSLTNFLEKNPDSRWNGLALFYIGDCYEKIGNLYKALFYYSKISKLELRLTPAASRLRNLKKEVGII